MPTVGILLILLAGWMALAIGSKLLCFVGRLVPLTILGVAVIGCLALFGPRSEHRVRFVMPGRGVPTVETNASILVLPKRASEIPIAAELAQNEPKPAPSTTAPSPSLTTIGAPEIQAQRPVWIDAPAKLVNSVYLVSVKSGLFASLPECQRALDLEMKREADHYINEYLGDEGASELVQIPLDYLKKNVKKAEYAEQIRSESVGPMHQIHVLLEFDENTRADFHHLQHEALVTDRLWYAGSGAALVLALLSTFYGYLKLDLRA
jgi:hypothetical protein